MQYDGSWRLYLPEEDEEARGKERHTPACLANGKMATLVALGKHKGVDFERSVIAPSPTAAVDEGPMLEALETFTSGTARLFERRRIEDGGETTRYVLKRAELQMNTGTFQSVHDVVRYDREHGNNESSEGGSDSQGEDGSSSVVAEIACSSFPLRQYPYVTMHTYRVRVRQKDPESEDAVGTEDGSARFFHEVRAPRQVAHTARFSSDTILMADGGRSVYMFSATASLPLTSGSALAALGALSRPGMTMCSSTCYLWEKEEEQVAFENRGFNVSGADSGVGFDAIDMRNGKVVETYDGDEEESTKPKIREYRFHAVTCTMTSFDTSDPETESKRVLLTLVARGAASRPGNGDGKIYKHLRSEHTLAWDAVWGTNVTIAPKLGITEDESRRLTAFKRNVRYALYNIYSSVRGGVERPFQPFGSGGDASVVDANSVDVASTSSRSFQDGELWFLPCLMALKPHATRAVLDARYAELPRAMRLAATYGRRGAMFPYRDRSAGGNSVAVFWDAASVTHVFNTALVGVNAWDYYRVTQDRDWLQSTGYPLLQGVANFAASVFSSDGISNSKYELTPSVALDGRKGAHNAFAVNACRLALKAATEAAYVLGLGVRREWTEVLNNALPITFQRPSSALANVFKMDAEHEAYEGPVRVAEPLMILSNTYSRLYLPRSGSVQQRTLRNNLAYYRTVLENSGTEGRAINLALRAYVEGLLAQEADDEETGVSKTETFFARMEKLTEACEANTADDTWGNLALSAFGERASRRSDKRKQELNDVNASALLIWTLLGAAAGARVVGGVTDTRFVYEDMKLEMARTRKMPVTWKDIRVTRVADGRTTALVTNELTYPPPS